jgi:hypothetical protein
VLQLVAPELVGVAIAALLLALHLVALAASEATSHESHPPVSVEERSSQLLGRIRKFFAL